MQDDNEHETDQPEASNAEAQPTAAQWRRLDEGEKFKRFPDN